MTTHTQHRLPAQYVRFLKFFFVFLWQRNRIYLNPYSSHIVVVGVPFATRCTESKTMPFVCKHFFSLLLLLRTAFDSIVYSFCVFVFFFVFFCLILFCFDDSHLHNNFVCVHCARWNCASLPIELNWMNHHPSQVIAMRWRGSNYRIHASIVPSFNWRLKLHTEIF